MRLGTDTGSINNYLMQGTRGQPEPVVGMGATILGWTDRHAATITLVMKKGAGLMIALQRDKAKRTDQNGMSESQSYEYERDPSAPTVFYRMKAPGLAWEEVRRNPTTNRWAKTGGSGLRLGERDEYHDYSF